MVARRHWNRSSGLSERRLTGQRGLAVIDSRPRWQRRTRPRTPLVIFEWIVGERVIRTAGPQKLVALGLADFFGRVVGHEEDHPDEPDEREREQQQDEGTFDHFSGSFHA